METVNPKVCIVTLLASVPCKAIARGAGHDRYNTPYGGGAGNTV
jgi:hypothetical protein